MIAGRIGEQIDLLLRDSQIVRVAEMIANLVFELIDVFDYQFCHGPSVAGCWSSRRTESVIPDFLVASTLRMQNQRTQRNLKDQTKGAAATQFAVKRGRHATGVLKIGIGPKSQHERRERRGYCELITKFQVVGHEQTRECVQCNNDQADYQAKRKSITDIPQIIGRVDDADQGEKTVQIEQHRRDLQSLGLHAVEPFAPINIQHVSIVADRPSAYR